MTKSKDSPVTRETEVSEKGRPLIVTLKGSTMEMRFKGKREVILLDYEVAVAAARKVAFREGGGQLPGRLGGRKFKINPNANREQVEDYDIPKPETP